MVSVSAGGALATLVEGAGGVALGLDGTIPMPRAALGALVAPVVAVGEDVGVLPGARAHVAAAVEQLRRRAALLARPDNPAAALARTIGRTWPLVWRRRSACGRRALEEPGQRERQGAGLQPTVPEVCHNELCGWGQHGDVTARC